ncbi:WXG100 family type VII secretion target [Streptomyces sp. NPDC092369]|uniref:WXG100 family type VII secretion target n=1 Tax=Streptomyces sp. NPDC092369 TaxID=3366015 RepID=UPI00382D1C2D
MPKGSDLQVDYDLLSTSAKQLAQIHREFKGLVDWKQDIRSLLGDSRVQSATADFVDNWDRNRKRLVEEIQEIGKMIKTTSDAFKSLDDDLADAGRGGKK